MLHFGGGRVYARWLFDSFLGAMGFGRYNALIRRRGIRRRTSILVWSLVIGWLLTAEAALAGTGWDSNDFLISGGPNFPDRIGVFDFDMSFKGYLDTNYIPVRG